MKRDPILLFSNYYLKMSFLFMDEHPSGHPTLILSYSSVEILFKSCFDID